MSDRPVDKNGRPFRLCDSCLAVDTDPRHVYGTSGAESDRVTYTREQREQAISSAGGDSDKLLALMEDFDDNATQMKHLDCCLVDGCPDGTCDARLGDKDDPFDGGETTGEALVNKLTKRLEKDDK